MQDRLLDIARDDAALPTGHLASRKAGLSASPRPGEREKAALSVSNLHVDRVDSLRRHGVPIVYVPRITDAARAQPGFDPYHPMPSSDLILAENGCSEQEGGGRFVRVATYDRGHSNPRPWALRLCL